MDQRENLMKKRMKKQYIPVIVVCGLILLLTVIGLGTQVVMKYIPTRERMDLTEYYGTAQEGEAIVVLGTDIMEERAQISGTSCICPLILSIPI